MAILNKVKNFIKGVETEKEDIDVAIKDEKILLTQMKFRRDEAEKLLKPKLYEWDRALKFFDGKHWELAGVSLPRYKADIVVNKWFPSVRSLVAFETDAKPDPEVEAKIDVNDENYDKVVEGAKKIEAMLDYRWDTAQVPIILTQILYDRYNFNDGFGWYFWNAEIDDVDFEQLKPHELLRAPGAKSIADAEYLIVKKQRNKKWFATYFPETLEEGKGKKPIKFEPVKLEEMPGAEDGTKAGYANMATIYHYFENEQWVTFMDDRILEKIPNPHWEFRSAETQEKELLEKLRGGDPEAKAELPADWQPVKNHLAKPEKPIIQFKGYYLGGEFYSKSLVKQVFKLALAINKRKSQIQDNADGVGNGQWLIDPSVPYEKVQMITSEAGLKIRINPSLAQKVPGTPLPDFIFADLADSKKDFDDIMGHHEVSRGAGVSKRQTKGEIDLLRETDITPVRLLMRNSESAINTLLNGWVQLMKIFYDQPHFIGTISGRLRESAGGMLKRGDIPDQLSIHIKVGSSLPTSREQKRVEFQNDLAREVIDPLTYLEMMNYPNPKRILQRVLNWRQGIISDEPPQQGQVPPGAAPPQ